jgi:hypothetical protein
MRFFRHNGKTPMSLERSMNTIALAEFHTCKETKQYIRIRAGWFVSSVPGDAILTRIRHQLYQTFSDKEVSSCFGFIVALPGDFDCPFTPYFAFFTKANHIQCIHLQPMIAKQYRFVHKTTRWELAISESFEF